MRGRWLRILYFIGIGLYDLKDLTLRGLEVLKEVDKVFIERYTNLTPSLNLKLLKRICRGEVVELTRRELEEESGEVLLREAKISKVALLSPGDPFIATTHISLRLEAERRGIKTEVIHAPSIISVAISASGLQAYKFGKVVTVVFPREGYLSETPYDVLRDNLVRGLHTLLLLEISIEEGKFMTVNEAIELLLKLERRRGEGIISEETLGVGLARLGSPTQSIKAGSFGRLLREDLGPPPHSLIVPGYLHPLEEEALKVLHGCTQSEVEVWTKRLRELGGT